VPVLRSQHPAQNLDAVRGAVREQYEQEQKAKREKPITPPTRKRTRTGRTDQEK